MRTPTWWQDYKRLSYVDPHWLIIWVVIYLGFLSLDILVPEFWGSALLKYVGIFLCIVYTFKKYPNDHALQLALLFTFLADTILVWTPFTIAGVYVFSFAQFMHLIRLTKLSPSSLGIFAMCLSFFFALNIANGLQPLYAIATVYGLELICNLTIATKKYLKEKNSFRVRCAFYGFIAFICCDICVALRFLTLDSILPDTLLPITSFLVWVFYYPSQVLIANSSTIEPKKPRKFAKNKSIS